MQLLVIAHTEGSPGTSHYPLITYRNVKLFHYRFGVLFDGLDE